WRPKYSLSSTLASTTLLSTGHHPFTPKKSLPRGSRNKSQASWRRFRKTTHQQGPRRADGVRGGGHPHVRGGGNGDGDSGVRSAGQAGGHRDPRAVDQADLAQAVRARTLRTVEAYHCLPP